MLSGACVAQPVITGTSSPTLARSDRLIITGSGFGAESPGSYVEVGGQRVAHARWSDSQVNAYALGSTSLGPQDVRVITPSGASNTLQVSVESASSGFDRIAWRFRGDGLYFSQRAAIGNDGTVYAQDVYGFLYAIAADGGLKWIYNAGKYPQGGGGEGPIAIGQDGTIYVSSNPLGPTIEVHAVNPDGTTRWVFTDPGLTTAVIAGPSVGPDGNVYVVSDAPGLGLFSLTPEGQLRWTNQGNPQIIEHGQRGADLVFGASSAGQPVDQVYCAFDEAGIAFATMYAFDMETGQQNWTTQLGGEGTISQFQPVVLPDGKIVMSVFVSGAGLRLRAYEPSNGSVNWTFFESPTNVITSPSAGADGTTYVGRNLGEVHAVSPNGTSKWTHTASLMFDRPVPSPSNDLVLMGGRITFGQPGFFRAINANDGTLLWHLDIPLDLGRVDMPSTPAVFTDNGTRAYIGATVLGMANNGAEYCYLYAIDAGQSVCYADCDGSGSLDFFDFLCFQNAFAGGCQ